jgi:hypothetical protein
MEFPTVRPVLSIFIYLNRAVRLEEQGKKEKGGMTLTYEIERVLCLSKH